MANEYLKRQPTSTGNTKVFTISLWAKVSKDDAGTGTNFFSTGDNDSVAVKTTNLMSNFYIDSNVLQMYEYRSSTANLNITSTAKYRDYGSWTHFLYVVDTTQNDSTNRFKFYVNGARVRDTTQTTIPSKNFDMDVNSSGALHAVGRYLGNHGGSPTYVCAAEMTDFFFIDGQALTPDVFGFYKVGKGYVSAGSTQATDFRPGQWVPKTPRVIKTAINNNGGFGVNGFYLPMNDSNNFGADFHCEPNSIIKLQENLPQPRCRIDGVGDYTGALRDDPFKQYLVLALPFVSGGLQSGFGDYSAAIKGSGSPKTLTNSNVSIGNTASYYGSAGNFTSASSSYITTPRNVSDYNMGSGDFNVEGWFYFKSINTGQHTRFFSVGNGTLEGILFELIIGTSQITFYSRDNTNNSNVINGPIIIAGQWYHIALCRKASTLSAYVNGVCVGTVDIASRTVNFDSNTAVVIGAWENSIGSYTRFSDAYLQDLRIYKGVAKYTGGFDVPRPYTPVGIATWRAVPDSPANNFATLNSIEVIASTGSGINKVLSNGNLTATTNGNPVVAVRGNFPVSSGKWYFEATNQSALGNTSQNDGIGVVAPGAAGVNGTTLGGYAIIYRDAGGAFLGNNSSRTDPAAGTHDTYAAGDIIGVALDIVNRDVEFFKNGVSVATYSFPSHIGTDEEWVSETLLRQEDALIHHNFGQNPTFSGNTTAGTFTDTNGKGLFKYQPPSGFLALCEDNLPTPAIANPGRHFKTVLYTGSGSSRNVVGVGFTPDLVWVKSRTNTEGHIIFDSVRGPEKRLLAMDTVAEATVTTGGVMSFDSDGYSTAQYTGTNQSGQNYVAWCWKAGAGTTSTNTNGSITSVVSVNQDAGFSIVSWTGNGTSGATVGHGINKPPKFIIVQTRQGTNNREKPVYHVSTGTNYATVLNGTSAGFVNSAFWNNTAPSSSLITLGNDQNTNQNTSTYIAYCWAEIEGFSKAFSYVGNGSADGPMIFLGLKPALIIIKRTNDAGNWQIYDSSRMSTNPNNGVLFPNSSNVEVTGSAYDIDFLSNGFKLRSTDTDRNASGSTYVGFAWAESPFQTANSK